VVLGIDGEDAARHCRFHKRGLPSPPTSAYLYVHNRRSYSPAVMPERKPRHRVPRQSSIARASSYAHPADGFYRGNSTQLRCQLLPEVGAVRGTHMIPAPTSLSGVTSPCSLINFYTDTNSSHIFRKELKIYVFRCVCLSYRNDAITRTESHIEYRPSSLLTDLACHIGLPPNLLAQSVSGSRMVTIRSVMKHKL
jgi:hypothetical protein